MFTFTLRLYLFIRWDCTNNRPGRNGRYNQNISKDSLSICIESRHLHKTNNAWKIANKIEMKDKLICLADINVIGQMNKAHIILVETGIDYLKDETWLED
jgi:hypothetical protein